MRKARARPLGPLAAMFAAALLAAAPAEGQGWLWGNSEPERPPVPEEPVYRAPPPAGEQDPMMQPRTEPAPGAQMPEPSAPPVNWATKNPICLQLEQRLAQDAQRSGGVRDRLPAIEAELRQTQQTYEQIQSDLERFDCYEYTIFLSKTVRRTRRCVDLAQQRDAYRRRSGELEAQLDQIANSSVRSYRADIVRELARNNCGANYSQEARSSSGGGSSYWQDEDESSFSNRWTPFSGGHSGMTYRTVCVRLCDGYYFPVSFSTLQSHFEQDAAACQSRCAAPAELYYYQNPGSSMDQSISFRDQQPYTSLKTAFRYRKELISGCSCKEAEYQDPDKRAEGGAATGWSARTETEARQPQ